MAKALADELETVFTADPAALRASLFGAAPLAQVMIAQDASPGAPVAPIGFAVWHTSFDVITGGAGLHLSDLYLDAGARGRGIALAMFRTLAQRVISLGGDQLTWSARVGASPGLTLYRSLGAIPLAAWTSRTLSGMALRAVAS
jgi:GNAT superfamily N-acetyltransferase